VSGRPPADRRRYEIQPEITVEWQVMRAKLRRRRVDRGLTQTDVALAMGRSQDFIAVLENNRSFPNVATLMLWINALGGELIADFPS
jgi:transcriptional regulator with XRE-family HTH domain